MCSCDELKDEFDKISNKLARDVADGKDVDNWLLGQMVILSYLMKISCKEPENSAPKWIDPSK